MSSKKRAKRNKMASVMLTPSEYKTIAAHARSLGRTLSGYLRWLALNDIKKSEESSSA